MISSLLIALLVTSYGCSTFSEESGEMPNVAIYAGKGAVLFEDVAYALELLDIKYETLDERDIKEGRLEQFDFLIIPGGYTREYMPALGTRGREAIRNFVQAGGCYMGICGGAYIASERVEVSGRPEGLGIIDIRNVRKSGTGMRKIHLRKHPITRGLGKELEIYYQNGPEMVAEGNVEEIAAYERQRACHSGMFFRQGQGYLLQPTSGGKHNAGNKAKWGNA